MYCEMKVLLGYKDIMALGFSKKTAYKMLNLICESEDYKKSNLAKAYLFKLNQVERINQNAEPLMN